MSELSQEVLKRIDALAEKLGTTGSHLWGVLVAQARVEAWKDALLLAVALTMFVVCALSIRWVCKYECKGHYDDTKECVIIPSCILGAVSFIAACCFTSDFMTAALNPEYFALKQVLSIMGR